MLSSGGIATVETAARFPIRLIESGPAAGALAAAHYGAAHRPPGPRLVRHGRHHREALRRSRTASPLVAHEFEVDRVYRFKRGTGMPVSVPVIDMIEIGAGGGSIARVDALGLLKVGPDCAGADPGPACYGRGGTQPTVTDADLVLGYLDPGFFLGGRMALDVERRARAIGRGRRPARPGRRRRPPGASTRSSTRAWPARRGCTRSSAARTRGACPLFAFGGAGPVHALSRRRGARLARADRAARRGRDERLGFLAAPLAFDFVRTSLARSTSSTGRASTRLLAEMEAGRRASCSRLGRCAATSHARALADMRYVGQGHEVRVPLPGAARSRDASALASASSRDYQRLYGRRSGRAGGGDQLARRGSRARAPSCDLAASRRGAVRGRPKVLARPTSRAGAAYVETPVYDRYALGPGARFAGPAIVEERESTLVVGAEQPGSRSRRSGSLHRR